MRAIYFLLYTTTALTAELIFSCSDLDEQNSMRPITGALVVVGVISTYLLASTCHAAKILFVPMNGQSHTMFFTRLAVDMAKLGHVTTVLATSSVRVPDFAAGGVENFTYVPYPVDGSTPFSNSPEVSERLIAMAMTASPLRRMQMTAELVDDLSRHGEQDCIRLLDNDRIMSQIREAGYDFAIMDPYGGIACYYAIPYSLGIPYASLSLAKFSAHRFRVPRLAAFPNLYSLNELPSFIERLTAFLMEIANTGLSRDNAYFMKKYAPNHPYIDTTELIRRQSLWLFVEELSVNYPVPQMPNTVAVGDIMARPQTRPPSGAVGEFVSKSKRGVIVASFGSFCDYFPPAITAQLCEAFAEVAKRFGLSVVWKLKAEGYCRNDDIFVSPWIPQNHLLADSRVKLFVSHGGINSIIESVYHSKPLVVFPIGLDQPANAAAAEFKGFAVQMIIADFTVEILVSNIEKLLTDLSYKHNAQLASAILRDRSDTPAQRVSAVIDHVIKYGDRHLRTGAFEMSTLQFMMFDIFAALFAAAAVLLSVVVLCCYCAYRKCHRPTSHGVPSQRKPKSH